MKRSIFRPFGLFLLLNLVLTLLVFGQSNRLELRTRNFNLFGAVSETELKGVARKLEKFQQAFQQIFPKTKIDTPFPTNVIIFKDSAELNSYLGSNKYFLSANDANYAMLAMNDAESFQTFYQNYTKFLLENNIGRNYLPAWLFEGLASHLENLKLSDEQNLAFETSARNINVLRTSRLIPVDILLETDHFTLRNQPQERKQIFHAEVWALVSYLLKDNRSLAKIEKFIELKKQGIENSKAMLEAFQISSAKIKEEFPKFVETNSFAAPPIQIPETISVENSGPVANLTESKWLAVQADFLFYADRLKESESVIEKSLKLERDQSLALTTLALIKAKTYYYPDAEKLAEKAIENEPENYLNQYRYALALSKRNMTPYGFVSGYNAGLANQMREALKHAIELNPDFTPSYALISLVNAVRNESLDESLGLINQAIKIAPGNHQYQLRLAELNLRKEKFTEARRLVLQVRQNTESEGVRLYAENARQRIDATEFQLESLRNRNAKYVNDDIVTDSPLSDEEIKRLREKANNEQIKATLSRPGIDEKRVFGSLAKVECGKNRVEFLFKTPTGLLKVYSNSLDGVRLLSLVEEMTDYSLKCGEVIRENNASVIFKNVGEIISIEFIPKGFK